jgi:UDPglucose 6-dehydrogenase
VPVGTARLLAVRAAALAPSGSDVQVAWNPEFLREGREVDSINIGRRARVVDLAVEECGGEVTGRRIGVLGAAFKPGTDDVRDSPALDVAAELQARGALVRVYDPRANATAATSHSMLSYAGSAADALRGAHLVLHLTEWPEFGQIDPAGMLPLVERARIVDARNALDADRWRAAGWHYRAPGRPRPAAEAR